MEVLLPRSSGRGYRRQDHHPLHLHGGPTRHRLGLDEAFPPSDLVSPDPLLAFGTPSYVALVLPLARYRSPRAELAPRNVPLSTNIISAVRIFMPIINSRYEDNVLVHHRGDRYLHPCGYFAQTHTTDNMQQTRYTPCEYCLQVS